MSDNNEKKQKALRGKLDVTATLRLETGLHIGASKDFAPIGAVDSPFVRDPFSRQPVIPGSSLKGTIRSLLARSLSEGYIMQKIENDPYPVQRLFGSANESNKGGIASRLQFFDLRMTEDSLRQFGTMEMDTYIGEVKFENGIDRVTATANPRQIERVPAGAEFAFRLVYNIENPAEVMEDIGLFAKGLKLLQMDYLGGSGSRGYGRVSLSGFGVSRFTMDEEKTADVQGKLDENQKLLESSRVS